MTAKRRQAAVLQVLRGEPLEVVARELRVTAADLSGWRDAFLEGGAESLKSRCVSGGVRLMKRAEALIEGAYLAGTNTRRVRRALAALFDGAIGKDVVSRAWRKVRTDWEAWNGRELHDEAIVRLIPDGTVIKAKIDRKATAISVLVAIGVRRDGQKVLLALRKIGGRSSAHVIASGPQLPFIFGRLLRRPGRSSRCSKLSAASSRVQAGDAADRCGSV